MWENIILHADVPDAFDNKEENVFPFSQCIHTYILPHMSKLWGYRSRPLPDTSTTKTSIGLFNW